MKKNIGFIFLLVALITICSIFAYADYDEPVNDETLSTVSASDVTLSISRQSSVIADSTTLLSSGVVSTGIPVYETTVRVYVKSPAVISGAAALSYSVTSGSGTSCFVGGGTKELSVTYNSSTGFYEQKIDYVIQTYNIDGLRVTCTLYGTVSMSKSTNISITRPVSYKSSFLLTYYIIANEADYSGTYSSSANGISGKVYKSSFLNSVKINGTGYSHYGTYIKYNPSTGLFTDNVTPSTAAGTTPTVGKTVAVDNHVIPRYSDASYSGHQWAKIQITSVGYRQAEDAGGSITGHHIDVFMGTGIPTSEPTWNNQYKTILYFGNNLY